MRDGNGIGEHGEPWELVPTTGISEKNGEIRSAAGQYICQVYEGDPQRIVECVNAMRGIDSPADFMRTYHLFTEGLDTE